MRESHSDKGLKTLTLMGTTPDDWGLTPIKWVWEKRLHPVKVRCKSCGGHGNTTVLTATDEPLHEVALKKFPRRDPSDPDYYKRSEWERDQRAKGLAKYAVCPTCETPRSKWKGTGFVIEYHEIDVLVGYPIWPKGVQFDSRFHNGRYYRLGSITAKDKEVHSVCELCSKSITGVWSSLVPVNARGKDGKLHGMYVGEDCARKFLGLQLILDEKQLKEYKKSERKEHCTIAITKE